MTHFLSAGSRLQRRLSPSLNGKVTSPRARTNQGNQPTPPVPPDSRPPRTCYPITECLWPTKANTPYSQHREHSMEAKTISRWTTTPSTGRVMERIRPRPAELGIRPRAEVPRKFRCTRRGWSTIPGKTVLPTMRPAYRSYLSNMTMSSIKFSQGLSRPNAGRILPPKLRFEFAQKVTEWKNVE